MDFEVLLTVFREHADPAKAVGMNAYMCEQFEFLGISSPVRASLTKEFYKAAKKAREVDWDFVDACWRCPYRELQYVAMGYLSAVQKLLTPKDVARIKTLAQTKSWWDTIDGLDRIVGSIALKYPEVNQTLLAWSTDKDFWLRRLAIDHQLGRKAATDTALLEQSIVNNFGQQEFFVNKAIGWSLRDYSKTDPVWVRAFIDRYRDQLAPLSIKEGSKYI